MFRKSMLILMIAVILFVTACSKDKTQDEEKRKQMLKVNQIHGLQIEN